MCFRTNTGDCPVLENAFYPALDSQASSFGRWNCDTLLMRWKFRIYSPFEERPMSGRALPDASFGGMIEGMKPCFKIKAISSMRLCKTFCKLRVYSACRFGCCEEVGLNSALESSIGEFPHAITLSVRVKTF